MTSVLTKLWYRRATDTFSTCLGSQAQVCLSPQNLQQLGLSPADAAVYATMADQLNFECGAGFQGTCSLHRLHPHLSYCWTFQ
jgi:hypothetical protein